MLPVLDRLPVILLLAVVGIVAMFFGAAFGIYWLIEHFDIVRVTQ